MHKASTKVQKLVDALNAQEQHDNSQFWGEHGEKSRLSSLRGCKRLRNKALDSAAGVVDQVWKLEETYTDDKGNVWNRPTAYAYAKVCAALDAHKTKLDALLNPSEEVVDEILQHVILSGLYHNEIFADATGYYTKVIETVLAALKESVK